MRDPKRIDEMLALVREIWLAQPDVRLGQLAETARIQGLRGRGMSEKVDTFAVEDDVVTDGLHAMIENERENERRRAEILPPA